MSRRNRRSTQDEEPQDSTGWMNTYADLMSLLLTFFVMVFALSTVDTGKYQTAMQSIQGAFGMENSGNTLQDLDTQIEVQQNEGLHTSSTKNDPKDMATVYQNVEDYVKKNNLTDDTKVTINERGILIRFVDTALFDTGKVDIKPKAEKILLNIGKIIKKSNKPIRVEGHTDDIPIRNGKYPTNWELSTNRATNVVRFFIEELDIDPSKVSAAGYGEYHPVADNSTAEGRAKNRRVDIIIINGSNN